jgi:hypothetical protein
MHRSDQRLGPAELNYEQWRDALRPDWGLYTPDRPKSFAGHVRSQTICGLKASQISNNAQRCERTRRDIRLDVSTIGMPFFRLVPGQRSSRMIAR